MRIRVLRTVIGTIAAVALALFAGACGSSGGGSSSVAVVGPLANAAYATSQAGGAHMAISARIEATGLPSAVTMDGSGFFNYKSHEGTLTITLAGLPASAVTGSSSPRMEEVFKGTSIYVGSSLFAGKLPGGARWMKLDLARFGAAAGINPTQMLGGQSNPAQFLDYLKATGGTVQMVGQDTVRGVQTTHYHGTIDLKKAAAVLTQHTGNSKTREAFEKEIAKIGLTSMPVDVWIDSHRLVRRIQLTFSANAGGQQVGMNMTIELFDFGPTPSVTAPASSEVFDATSSALGSLNSFGG